MNQPVRSRIDGCAGLLFGANVHHCQFAAFVGGLDPDGWSGVMRSNRALALQARERLQTLFGVEPLAPESMVGAMPTVRVPGVVSDDAAMELMTAFHHEAHIEVPFPSWPVPGGREHVTDPPSQVLIRVSAQRYNDASDVDRLVAELTERRVGTERSAIVSG